MLFFCVWWNPANPSNLKFPEKGVKYGSCNEKHNLKKGVNVQCTNPTVFQWMSSCFTFLTHANMFMDFVLLSIPRWIPSSSRYLSETLQPHKQRSDTAKLMAENGKPQNPAVALMAPKVQATVDENSRWHRVHILCQIPLLSSLTVVKKMNPDVFVRNLLGPPNIGQLPWFWP